MFEPLATPMAIAVFFTMWWVVLFAVLPFGIKSQEESGEVVKGSEPGAPVATGMGRKVLITTAITMVLFAGLIVAMRTFA